MNLVTKTYGDGAMAAGKADCWTVMLTMVRTICKEIRNFRVESETVYGFDDPSVMVGE